MKRDPVEKNLLRNRVKKTVNVELYVEEDVENVRVQRKHEEKEYEQHAV